MKKKISVLLTILLLASSFVFFSYATTIVDSGACGDDLTWTLDSDGLLTVSGVGEMTDYGYRETPWYPHASEVKKAILDEGVKSVGERAFYDCVNMVSVEIPDGVERIGGFAFFSCGSLDSVKIPETVKTIGEDAFSLCEKLISVTIPDGVESIDAMAFGECTSLQSITIPASVTKIGIMAFAACPNLTEIVLDPQNRKYSFYDNCLIDNSDQTLLYGNANSIIPGFGQVKHIGVGAFIACMDLTDIIIPNQVLSIGNLAFEDCRNLKSITLGKSVVRIGEESFHNCCSLNSITLPDSVSYIGTDAFNHCLNLKYMVIGTGMAEIVPQAIEDCPMLSDVYYAGTSEEWAAIRIGRNNADLLAARLHFNSTGPAAEPEALPGDVTGDGLVTAEDARLALRRAVGLETYREGSLEYIACDVTYDGIVMADNARLILRAAVGLEPLA